MTELVERRRFLLGALAATGAFALTPVSGVLSPAVASSSPVVARLWSDPGTWPTGRVPGPNDHVVIDKPVLLGGAARAASVTVAATGTLQFDPVQNAVLEVSGNVVVRGKLEMRPSSAVFTHRLTFVGVDESAFVGSSMQVLGTDVGLWVLDDGVLDLCGTPRAGWRNTGRDVTWRSGDVILRAPQTPGDYQGFQPYDGQEPTVVHDGKVYATEYLNLTRNVVIGGTTAGRAHVMILHARKPQTIRFVTFQHVGPRRITSSGSEKILGRYGLHFHHCGDGSRGSLVEGVVVRDAGAHAFVPHSSHGITFRDCLSYNTMEDAYWWDPDAPGATAELENASNDISYLHCGAFLVSAAPGASNVMLTGFHLGQGTGNQAVDCIAVGVQGVETSSGYHWPESANHKPNRWVFRGCRAHNNLVNGVRIWQNDAGEHVLEGFVAYRNGWSGIDHGAYRNRYRITAAILFQNGYTALGQHSLGTGTHSPIYESSVLDASGKSHAIVISRHALPSEHPVRVVDCRLLNAAVSPVQINEVSGSPGFFDFVRSTVGPASRDLEPTDFVLTSMLPGSRIRVQRRDGSAYSLDHLGRRSVINSFA